MSRYTFVCEHFKYDSFHNDELDVESKHTTEFRVDNLSSVLEQFELFLKGVGFQFDGVLDIVPPEEDRAWTDEEWEKYHSDYPSEEEDVSSKRWEKIVERHMIDIENDDAQRENCEVCKLPLQTMVQHSCFDEKCPLKKK
jgi:hypothetical protein